VTDPEPPLTRRRWREERRPPVRHWRHGFFATFRRDDPVFVVAAFLLSTACVGMWVAAFGGKGRARMSPDESAVVMAVCAGVMTLALLAVAIRLLVKPGWAPVSVGGAIFFVCVGALSMTVLIARAEGVLSPSVVLMFWSMGVCAVVGAAAVTLSFVRSPARAADTVREGPSSVDA